MNAHGAVVVLLTVLPLVFSAINGGEEVKPVTPAPNCAVSKPKLCTNVEAQNGRYATTMLWGTVQALCDTETDGGGWVIIQRRTRGDTDFYKSWCDYQEGFGTPDTDFWLGLDNIHNLTSHGCTELRVDMEYKGKKYFAVYSNFSVADEASKYKLTVGNYSGTAGDSLSYHNGMYFSTYDSDNDDSPPWNCAELRRGAWWYHYCYHSNLNGVWGATYGTAMAWVTIIKYASVSLTEMKVRYV